MVSCEPLESLFTGKQSKTTSLCPVLGKIHAQVFHNHGSCLHYTKNLFGNKIPVYFIGVPPFIYFKTGSGSDFNLAKILAKKYAFNMEFHPAKISSELVQIVRLAKRDACQVVKGQVVKVGRQLAGRWEI